MTLASLLPIAVVIPLAGAVLAPLAAHLDRRLPLAVGVLSMLGTLALLATEAARVYGRHATMLSHYLSNEHPVHGRALGIGFTADPFGMTYALLVAAVGVLLFVAMLSELGELGPRELGGLAGLAQLLIAALIGAALTADTINLFVWFELAALSSYGLTGFFLERPIALEAAFKNLVLTSTAGFCVFLGAAMLYRTTGALNMAQLQAAFPHLPSRAELIGVTLLVAGFATKAGIMPFHGWLPDAHTPVPGAISALFSGLMVGLGIVALARVSLQLFPAIGGLSGLLTALGCISAVVGALMALVQDDLKRLLAYDTASQMGIVLVGIGSRTGEGVAGAVYQLVSHGVFKALLFLCAGAVVHATGKTKLSELGGLARSRPLLTAGFTAGCLAISGIPPLNGWASLALIHKGIADEPMVFAVALVAQTVTVAVLARAAWLGFYRRRAEPYEHLERIKIGMGVSLVLLATGCVVFGVFASAFVGDVAAPAASVLLHPTSWAQGVLHGPHPVPGLDVSFDYADPTDLITTACEVVVGLALAVLAVRRPTRVAAPLRPLRALHTGSVNDYAAYVVVGLLVTGGVLLA